MPESDDTMTRQIDNLTNINSNNDKHWLDGLL